jgi:predicted MFS family arabinose efflux permease
MSANLTEKTPARDEFARNWTVVLAAAFGMALASVNVYAMGVFLQPLEQEFGWKRSQIAAGMTVSSVFAVLTGPFIGLLVDRVGPRRIGMFGAVAGCLSIAAFSFVGSAIWMWWALWLPAAMAGAFLKPTVWATAVSSLFDAGRGMALALMLSGTALCSTLTPIVGTYFVATLGWRQAYLALAGFWAVLVVPIVWLFLSSAKDRDMAAGRSTGAAGAEPPGLGIREALLSGRFARLALAGFLASLVVVSFVTGLVPILTSQTIDRQSAGYIAGLVGISTVVGRLTGGYLLDRLNGNLIGAVSMLLPVIPCALLLLGPGSVPLASAAVIVLGLSLGVELDVVAYLVGRHFGMRNYGTLFGTIAGLLALATGLGPVLVNLVYDFTGSYSGVLLAYIPLSLLAAALFASLGRYPVFSADVPSASNLTPADRPVPAR